MKRRFIAALLCLVVAVQGVLPAIAVASGPGQFDHRSEGPTTPIDTTDTCCDPDDGARAACAAICASLPALSPALPRSIHGFATSPAPNRGAVAFTSCAAAPPNPPPIV